MSEATGTNDKIGKPLSVGGITTLLVGLCAYLDPEYQKIGILLSSFLSPLIIHLAFALMIRVSIDPELTKYLGALNRDLKNMRKQMKSLDKKSDAYKKIKAIEAQTIVLMASAHQDHASGKLSLKAAPRPDIG